MFTTDEIEKICDLVRFSAQVSKRCLHDAENDPGLETYITKKERVDAFRHSYETEISILRKIGKEYIIKEIERSV